MMWHIWLALLTYPAVHGHTCSLSSASPFQSCQCNVLSSHNAELRCMHQNWLSVPSLSQVFVADDNQLLQLQKLVLERNAITFLGQDSFKNTSIESMELSHNNIAALNVNAFRGLENTLKLLNLENNNMVEYPYWAFTFLRELQHLKLQNNQITDIAVNSSQEMQMNNLRFLHLDGNKLVKLKNGSLSGLPLNILTLSNNQIKEIESNALPPTLAIIDLSGNLFEQIPYNGLSRLQQIQQISLSSNRISMLDPDTSANFKNDIKLNLANNKLFELGPKSFASFKRLNDLDLDMNQIGSIHEEAFNNVQKLEKVSMRFNQLLGLPEQMFQHLGKTIRRINLGHNSFTNMPNALRHLHSLEVLEFQNNKLNTIDKSDMSSFKHTLKNLRLDFNRLTEVHHQVFEDMQRLEYLDLSNNKIKNLGRMSFGTTNGAAGSLQELNMAGNEIEEITDAGSFLYFASLKVLNLSYNKLRTISGAAFNRLTSMITVNLKGNKFTEFPKTALYNLKKLSNVHLENNFISELPVRLLEYTPNLVELHLSHNRITSINDQIFHISSSGKIRFLDISNNMIAEIGTGAFEDLRDLVHLDLHGNDLGHLNPQTYNNLPSLQHLNLERNNIGIIHDFCFNQLHNLSFLNLGYNQLAEIRPNSFQNVTRIHHLTLSHNLLRSFDFDFLNNQVEHLKVLDLGYNSLDKADFNLARHSMHFLSLRHNDFEFIDNKLLVSGTDLRALDFSLNSIMEVHIDAFQKSTKLARIDLHGNQLTTLWRETFANQHMIETLDVSFNFLTDLETGVFGKDNLQRLNMAHNNLSSVPTKALAAVRKSLLELDLSNNNLRSLDKNDFAGLDKIERLILSNNKIESIESNAFEELSSLQYLDLSGNPITTWNPHAFHGISHVLKSVNVAGTGLFSLPRITTRSLEQLNVSRNNIYEVQAEDVEHLRKLKVLDLSDNNINDMKAALFDALGQLKVLSICGNPIKRLNKGLFTNLKLLEVLHICRLPHLVRLPEHTEFENLIRLQQLKMFDMPSVTNYNITAILDHLPPLNSLDFEVTTHTLSDQLLRADLRLLNELTIRGKKMKIISAGALNGVRRYRLHLTIRDTSITKLPVALFDEMNSIRYLSLTCSHNKIETLEGLFKHGQTPVLNQHGTILDSLNLHENPLVCDCRMKWLSEWIDYMAQQEERWPTARHSLATSKCTDRPGGQDNLLNMYDRTNKHYKAFHKQELNQNKRRTKSVRNEKLSQALDCGRRKTGTGPSTLMSMLFGSSTAQGKHPAVVVQAFLAIIIVWL